ncbi:MAG: ribosome assembly cofactor RimP [Prevotellaceae bacterium]|jgi:ribosome maturation factor RimP|nr:ribosome assembly cofactor RimP [Prevotellaceae bacterium]
MIDRTIVVELVEKSIVGTDMFIIDVEVKPNNIISIVLDSDTVVDIDNCADINRFVCSGLESSGEDDFEVTVYSAGLSEPLKQRRQYIKHTGEEVEVLRKSGEKRKGILRRVEENFIEIEYSIKEKPPGAKKKTTVLLNDLIEIDSIKSTKLVIKV